MWAVTLLASFFLSGIRWHRLSRIGRGDGDDFEVCDVMPCHGICLVTIKMIIKTIRSVRWGRSSRPNHLLATRIESGVTGENIGKGKE